jgi:hypothetical protein
VNFAVAEVLNLTVPSPSLTRLNWVSLKPKSDKSSSARASLFFILDTVPMEKWRKYDIAGPIFVSLKRFVEWFQPVGTETQKA